MTNQVIVVKEDNWYVATDISTGITSQGRTEEEALASLKEALDLYSE